MIVLWFKCSQSLQFPAFLDEYLLDWHLLMEPPFPSSRFQKLIIIWSLYSLLITPSETGDQSPPSSPWSFSNTSKHNHGEWQQWTLSPIHLSLLSNSCRIFWPQNLYTMTPCKSINKFDHRITTYQHVWQNPQNIN